MWLLTASDHQKALAFEILRLCLPVEPPTAAADAETSAAPPSGVLESIAEQPETDALDTAPGDNRVEATAAREADQQDLQPQPLEEPEVRHTRNSRARTALTIQFSGVNRPATGARSDSRLSTCLARRTPPAVEHTRVGSACHIRDREADRDILILHPCAN